MEAVGNVASQAFSSSEGDSFNSVVNANQGSSECSNGEHTNEVVTESGEHTNEVFTESGEHANEVVTESGESCFGNEDSKVVDDTCAEKPIKKIGNDEIEQKNSPDEELQSRNLKSSINFPSIFTSLKSITNLTKRSTSDASVLSPSEWNEVVQCQGIICFVMPVIKKVSGQIAKHHPYLATEQTKILHQNDTSRARNCIKSVSDRNVADSLNSDFTPRSVKNREENSAGWKLSFCGVLSSNSMNDICKGTTSDVNLTASNAYESSSKCISNNGKCENSSNNTSASLPISVPMRESRKRKSCFRSSGGYFFDKYMKRFQSKGNCDREIGHSETIDELKVSQYHEKQREKLLKICTRSNREDLVYNQPIATRDDFKLSQSSVSLNEVVDTDDLYPLRFGSSSNWLQETCSSSHNLVDNEGSGVTASVFPSSPPRRFWGDSCASDWNSSRSVSPVPSLTGSGDVACAYGDSNSESLKAMETLYLCNFRVVVDGDWLCLREINDETNPSSMLIANSLSDESTRLETDESFNNASLKNTQEMNVERKNLLNMAKLSIKGLIESSLSAGHTLDSDHQPLEQFFIIMEYVLRHGLKTPKNFFLQNKYFWPPLEAIEKLCPDACEITNSVRSLPGIRTHLGKGRAWLRLALMQKKLADYFQVFIESREIIREWYDDGALVLNDEAAVLHGHLVGLNCIDANLCMKGDDLDNQVSVIDYSLYMKDSQNYGNQSDVDEETESTLQKLVDQKNYLEERNRHLETVASGLQKKSDLLYSSNQHLQTEVEALNIQIQALKGEKEKMMSENTELAATHQRNMEDRVKDLDTERDVLRQSKNEMDEMCSQVQAQLKQEGSARVDLEKQLETQKSMKDELEMAMKLLEKDIYIKQDGLVTLREQLDNVKAINVDIYKKLQAKSEIEEENNKTIEKVRQESDDLSREISNLQSQLEATRKKLDEERHRAERSENLLDDSEMKRSTLLTNLQIEREWRQALQTEEEKHLQEIALLNEKVEMMSALKGELKQMTLERDDLRESCHEQELTISDLAGHLGRSKQDLGDLKEVHKSLTGNTWEKDKEVKACWLCEKAFNLSRRKHHCRNCGQIFCNACSDNTMPLASSSKPVRVCDGCHTSLLQRFSAGT